MLFAEIISGLRFWISGAILPLIGFVGGLTVAGHVSDGTLNNATERTG